MKNGIKKLHFIEKAHFLELLEDVPECQKLAIFKPQMSVLLIDKDGRHIGSIAVLNEFLDSTITTDDEQEKLKQPPFVRG